MKVKHENIKSRIVEIKTRLCSYMYYGL